jgi:predicted GIY-YIG superfamily endonuclease
MYERVRQLSMFPDLRRTVTVYPPARRIPRTVLPPCNLDKTIAAIESAFPLGPGESYVYKIHFDRYYGRARHYTGTTGNIRRRFKDHQNGNGAILMYEISRARIPWRVGGIWRTTAARATEKEMKRKTPEQSCFICAQQYWERRLFPTTRRVPLNDFPARR